MLTHYKKSTITRSPGILSGHRSNHRIPCHCESRNFTGRRSNPRKIEKKALFVEIASALSGPHNDNIV
jgi:hypothetical protein